MESTISLKLYSLRISEYGKPKNILYFNDIVFDTLNECIDEIAKPTSAKTEMTRNFSVGDEKTKTVTGADRYLCGVVRAGTTGYASEIIEKEGRIAFQREPKHTEVLPYFFYASMPENDRSPIICIQQISGNGLYVFFAFIFLEKLRRNLKKHDVTVRLNPIFLNALYINQFYENGVVKKITAIQHRLASDNADDAREARIASEINLSPIKKNTMIATLKELLTRDNKVTTDKKIVFENIKEIFELDADPAGINELIIEAELNGIKRKLAIGSDYGTAFDVTNDVKKNKDGFPDRAELETYITNFLHSSIRPFYRGH